MKKTKTIPFFQIPGDLIEQQEIGVFIHVKHFRSHIRGPCGMFQHPRQSQYVNQAAHGPLPGFLSSQMFGAKNPNLIGGKSSF
jgi:hypothetical protein